jgi:hypothetical protein
MTTPPPLCPECGTGIQPDWDWCHGCGFDPDHLRPVGWMPSGAAMAQAPGAAQAPAAEPRRVGTTPDLDRAPAAGPPSGTAFPSVPKRRGVGGHIVQIVVVALVVVAAVGAVGYVVLHGSMNKKGPQATPEFAAGLADVFSDSSQGAQAVALPDGLAGCVQAKLTPGDIDAVSALQQPSSNLDPDVEIRTYRAARACDRAGVSQAVASQGNEFAALGVNSIDQQQCVKEHLVDFIAALDDTKPYTTADTRRGTQDAFQACVSINSALKSILEGIPNPPTPDQAACMADEMAPSISWSDLFSDKDPAVGAKISGLTRTAATHCPA